MDILNLNARDRLAINDVLFDIDMEFVSTPAQVERGTLVWRDPHTDIRYAIYASGYVRRMRKSLYWPPASRDYRERWVSNKLNREIRLFDSRYTMPIEDPNEALGRIIRAIYRDRKR